LPLLNHYLALISEEYQITRRFDNDTLALLLNHDYPGNIRELRNLVESLCVAAETELITPDLLLNQMRSARPEPATTLQTQLEVTEKRVISRALEEHKSIRRAAKALGISHNTLLRRMQKYGLKTPN